MCGSIIYTNSFGSSAVKRLLFHIRCLSSNPDDTFLKCLFAKKNFSSHTNWNCSDSNLSPLNITSLAIKAEIFTTLNNMNENYI